MAGMEVVVVQCDKAGNVDVRDFRTKAEQYSDRLAALMAIYPSTHGVFEEAITDICDIVHQHSLFAHFSNHPNVPTAATGS